MMRSKQCPPVNDFGGMFAGRHSSNRSVKREKKQLRHLVRQGYVAVHEEKMGSSECPDIEGTCLLLPGMELTVARWVEKTVYRLWWGRGS